MPITPNILMDLPQTGADDNVWDDKLNAALELVDSHDHTSSKGVRVPVAGLNIDTDLPLNGNSLVDTKQLTLNNQTVAGTQNTTLKFINGELWSFDINGVGTQITLNGSVNATVPFSTNTPAGMVVDYAGDIAPAGYLLCDGSVYNFVDYPLLGPVLGNKYGGDGITTFGVPDARGRVAAGRDDMGGAAANRITLAGANIDGTVLGASGGVQTVTLTQAQTPLKSHSHTASSASAGDHTHSATTWFKFGPGSSIGTQTIPNDITTSAFANTQLTQLANAGAHTHGITVNSQGDATATAHTNTQPTLILNKIIKT